MRTVSIFKNGKNQAVRPPKDMEFDGVSELEIVKNGDSITSRPLCPSWLFFADQPKADDHFCKTVLLLWVMKAGLYCDGFNV